MYSGDYTITRRQTVILYNELYTCLGGDAHNVLGSFPTLRDPRLASLYTPMWNLYIAEWSAESVANGTNVTQKDANAIRQLAVQGIVTNPGGGMLGSANFVVNCPVLGFADEAPAWLWKQWVNVLHVWADGVPVVGFTWYSPTDQIDWDVELTQKRDHVNARLVRPVAACTTCSGSVPHAA